MRNILILLFLLSFIPPTYADQFDDGYVAYHRGKYAEAIKLLTAPAEHGNVDAQLLLGETYEELGDDMDASSKKALRLNSLAVKWYRKAAEQGNADAQYNLGWMYEEGWGGLKSDYVQAYMWLRLAEKKHVPEPFEEPTATRIRALKTKMTPLQVDEAKLLTRKWKPTPSHYAPPPAKYDKDYQH